jgi:Flp pilus assembly protein TadD
MPPGEAFVDATLGERKRDLKLYLLVGVVAFGLVFCVALLFLKRDRSQSPGGRDKLQSSSEELSPDVETLSRLASQAIGREQWSEARKSLDKLVMLQPRNEEIYNNLGLVLRKLGDKDGAYREYEKALSIRKDYPEAEHNLGVLYFTDHRLTEALGHFRRALELKSDFAEPYFHLAMIAEAQGHPEEAKGHFKKFLDLARNLDASFILEVQNRIRMLEPSG